MDAQRWFDEDLNGARFLVDQLYLLVMVKSEATKATDGLHHRQATTIENRTLRFFLYWRITFLTLAMRGAFSQKVLAVQALKSDTEENIGIVQLLALVSMFD
jgi:hypothetical protein